MERPDFSEIKDFDDRYCFFNGKNSKKMVIFSKEVDA